MSHSQRYIGLQIERTSLSWLRTFLVMVIMSVLLLKVSYHDHNIILLLNALTVLCFLGYLWCYRKKRFSILFYNKITIENQDVTVKKGLSILIFISAFIYFSFSIYQYFF